jgi:site-specific DNA recombinase
VTRKRAGIYGRNSKGETKSIADQLKLGRAAVKAQDWELAGEYSDDSSASRYRQKERKDWQRLLADLDAGALDVLVLYKAARGSRDEVDWFLVLRLCRKHGVLIHVMADRRTYDLRLSRDWKTLAEDGVTSAYYSEELSESVRRGTLTAAADGRPHGRVTYGYEREYSPDDGRMTGQRPGANAPVVREIFAELARHTPINTLEAKLRERGLPSPAGATWRRTTIRNIATNPAYIGKRRHVIRDKETGAVISDEVHNGSWPALVDEEMFWTVQNILNQPERKTTRPGSAKYLLSYIAVAPCGGPLSGMDSRRREAQDRYACGRDGCVSIGRPDMDLIVSLTVLAHIRRHGPKLLAHDGTAAAQAEADRYRAQLEEARRSFERPDGISAEALARKERALLPLIEDAARRARPAGVAGALSELVGADDVYGKWREMELAARREVVKSLAHVVLGKATRHMPRNAAPKVRLAETVVRLGESTWAGRPTPWRELGSLRMTAEGLA